MKLPTLTAKRRSEIEKAIAKQLGKGIPITYQERNDKCWCSAVLTHNGEDFVIRDIADNNSTVLTFNIETSIDDV